MEPLFKGLSSLIVADGRGGAAAAHPAAASIDRLAVQRAASEPSIAGPVTNQ
jgi:hypothetical protein